MVSAGAGRTFSVEWWFEKRAGGRETLCGRPLTVSRGCLRLWMGSNRTASAMCWKQALQLKMLFCYNQEILWALGRGALKTRAAAEKNDTCLTSVRLFG